MPSLHFLGSLSLKDRLFLTKQLSVMIRAGLPLNEALQSIAEERRGLLSRLLSEIRTAVERGKSLHASLSKFPRHFDPFFVQIVRIGEESGTLDETFDYLATHFQKTHELRTKIRSALLYPFIVTSFTIVVALVILIFVFPRLITFFKSAKMPLPLPTRLLLGVGEFVQENWLALLIAHALILTFLAALYALPATRKIFQRLILSLPLIGSVIRQTNAALLLRTTGTLLANGVPILTSITITRDAVGNLVYQDVLTRVYQEVNKGSSLKAIFLKFPHLFPKTFIQMIGSGEATGRLPQMMIELAEFYEAEVEQFTKQLTTFIEPLLLILIGSAIGFIALSLLMPIYQFTQFIQQR